MKAKETTPTQTRLTSLLQSLFKVYYDEQSLNQYTKLFINQILFKIWQIRSFPFSNIVCKPLRIPCFQRLFFKSKMMRNKLVTCKYLTSSGSNVELYFCSPWYAIWGQLCRNSVNQNDVYSSAYLNPIRCHMADRGEEMYISY